MNESGVSTFSKFTHLYLISKKGYIYEAVISSFWGSVQKVTVLVTV